MNVLDSAMSSKPGYNPEEGSEDPCPMTKTEFPASLVGRSSEPIKVDLGEHTVTFLMCMDIAAATTAKSLQSCPTLCNPTDGKPPGSPIPGILQARTLEWVAISFSNA